MIMDLEREPTGDTYVALLRFGARICDRALLVVRRSLPLVPVGRDFLKLSEPYLDSVTSSSEWPGTVLIGDEADVYRFRLDSEFVVALSQSVGGLYEWQQPHRPEDLCLIRHDGRAWLTSVAHERDAWLEIDPEEQAEVSQIPGLQLKARDAPQ